MSNLKEKEDLRFMRLLVFFDLPTNTKKDRKVYTKFRRSLINDGFTMIQFSVYSRVCKGQDSVENHTQKLQKDLPEKGNVRVMQVTEKQYERMKILVGTEKKEEKNAGQQLLLF